jgi:membrane-associated phospholipid phosphatase
VALGVYGVMILTTILLTPFLLALFTLHQKDHRLPLRQFPTAFIQNHYYLHALTYGLMLLFRRTTDYLNDPLKPIAGDHTALLYAIEGRAVYYVQALFENLLLTTVLNFHYLFIYLFLIFFTPLYFIYSRDRDLADKAVLNYVFIYVLAVPYYLFFNVEVTSTFIPGMKALLYHHNPAYFEFFTTNDPLDNAVPSLHMAIPLGLLFIGLLHMREKGIKLRQWRHRHYHWFITINTAIFSFSILYLGIHWILDIFAGALLALVGALFIHAVQPRLRNPRMRTAKPRRNHLVRNTAWTLALATLLTLPLVAVQANDDDQEIVPNMQLGPGDTNLNVFGTVPAGSEVRVLVRNIGTEPVYALLIERELLHESVEAGSVNWTRAAQNHTPTWIGPQQAKELRIKDSATFHSLVVHDPRPVPEGPVDEDDEPLLLVPAMVHVKAVYPMDVYVESLLISIPSHLVTAFVLHRQWRLWRAGESWWSSRAVG